MKTLAMITLIVALPFASIAADNLLSTNNNDITYSAEQSDTANMLAELNEAILNEPYIATDLIEYALLENPNFSLQIVKQSIKSIPELAVDIVRSSVQMNHDLAQQYIDIALAAGANPDEVLEAAIEAGANEADISVTQSATDLND